MFAMTSAAAAAVFGQGRGDWALLAMPVLPGAVLADGVMAGAQAARGAVGWLRLKVAAGLRAVAQAMDPLPVAQLAEYPVAQVAAVAEPAPVILPMPSAAQVTTEDGPAVLPLRLAGDDLAAALEKHGSARAAARALGIAESTFRGRCRKAGVPMPGRKAKG